MASAVCAIAESYKEHIDILITDVVMPGIGGRELAKKLLALRPGISVLYLSGYTEDAVVTPGALGPGTAIPAKTLHPSESRQESPRSPSLPPRRQIRHQVGLKLTLLVWGRAPSPVQAERNSATLPAPAPQRGLFGSDACNFSLVPCVFIAGVRSEQC